MPYITLPKEPGINALYSYKPTTAVPLKMLAQAMLRGHSSLSPGERELIAAFVSRQNDCVFCYLLHAHVANILLDSTFDNIADIIHSPGMSRISDKIKALMRIAGAIVICADRDLDKALVYMANNAGATDEEIHDTVLIASAFCMFNRYVDGLSTDLPKNQGDFLVMAKHLATNGYI